MPWHRPYKKNRPPEYKMSSALRTVSQIETHVKFLRGVNDQEGSYIYVSNTGMADFLDGADEVIESPSGINTVAKSSGSPTDEQRQSSTSTALVRDLGRRVTVTDPDSCAHRQVWIQVQAVNGSGSEGVEDASPVYGTFWICTYVDDTSVPITWARLG